jgi:carboxyl-terminal processing protease
MFSTKSLFTFLLGFAVAWILAFWNMRNAWSTFSERFSPGTDDNSKSIVQEMSNEEKAQHIFGVLDKAFYYKEDIDLQKMQENALKWYVEALGDPHTEYLTKEENDSFSESMEWSQNFDGIWAVVTKKKDGIMISEVLKWSPAFKAWIQPLDIILKIEEESTQEMSLSEWVKKIRGARDTTVNLLIYRQKDEDDEPEVLEIAVTRWPINVPSVTLEMLPVWKGKAAHLEVSIFGEDTITKLRELLLTNKETYNALILDLRWNGWWYLPTAVELASFFLKQNEIITTAKYSVLPEEVFRSEWYTEIGAKPVVVLIDWMSASASEIVAWALQQRGNVVIAGTKSFGKWSVQTIETLEDWSMLKFTIWRRYLPDGETIDKIWITPDVEIELDPQLYTGSGIDSQLEKAKELLLDPSYWLEKKSCCN